MSYAYQIKLLRSGERQSFRVPLATDSELILATDRDTQDAYLFLQFGLSTVGVNAEGRAVIDGLFAEMNRMVREIGRLTRSEVGRTGVSQQEWVAPTIEKIEA